MYTINRGKVLRTTRYVEHIAMADVRDYIIAAMMGVYALGRGTGIPGKEMVIIYSDG